MKSIFSSSHSKTSYPASTSPSLSPAHHHTFSESLMEENIEIAEAIIKKWNPETSTYCSISSLFSGNRREAKEFLKCVEDLQKAMHFFVNENSSSRKLIHAQNLMQIAMKRLEKEFYQILSRNREHLDPESISGKSFLLSDNSRTSTTTGALTNSDYEDSEVDEAETISNSGNELETVSVLAMNDLKAIAESMISAGYGKECVKIYKIIRKSIIDERLYKLGIGKMTQNQVQKMDWEVLEFKIKNWLSAAKVAVKTLFDGERILCDYVFSYSGTIREACFFEISKEAALNLFSFPELFAKCKNSPEKMFRILDLYDSISELYPEIESIFSSESTSIVRSQALNSLMRLGDSVRSILTEFESAIQKDSLKSAVPGGGIHPLTRYVMNYICFLSDYSGILSDLISDWPAPEQTGMPDSYFRSPGKDEQTTAIAVRFAWLVLVLLCKLDGKTELYKEVALSYLFLANNLNYVVSKVRSSNLRLLFGEDWISKHEIKVTQYAANYERMGWSKVMSSLPDPTALVPVAEAKECFLNFNSAFETAYRVQSSWVISDGNLRDDIKVSLCNKLVPAYQVFYERYRLVLKEERNLESVIRYSPDDLSNYLSDLFYGKGVSGSSSGHSQSR